MPAPLPLRAGPLPLRPELRGIAPYGAPQLSVPARLNVNENPYSPAPEVVAEIAAAVTEIAATLNRYPDRDFTELREALADYLAVESGVRVEPEQIWAGNGSNEVMLHLLQAFGGPGRTVASFAPTYSMYPEYARDTFTGWVAGKRSCDFTLDMAEVRTLIADEQPSILLLASPNNPTGTALPLADIAEICDFCADSGPVVAGEKAATVVVIDEAYGEFRRTATPSAMELLADYPHLAVSRTMSKAFGMAGLRLGYLAAAQPLVDSLRVVRLPYHLSAVSQATALAALRHQDELMAQVGQLRAARDDMVLWLRDQGLTAVESDANFVMFGRFQDREAIFQSMLDQGVLIRVVGPEGFLRVSMGTPAENTAFQEALVRAMAQNGESR